ncbi:MAG: hypothetical protein FJX72_14490, partial [Armatimonadetes bacterium]|nr:hypothetical protein [Armatimonadota bacterium]
MVRLALLWLWSASVAASAPVPVRAAHVPLIAPDQAVMRLDELGLYRVGYAHDGKQETDKRPGWSGHFEEPSGMSCQPFGEQGGRSATLLHCPWRDGVGLAYQEFAFVVPRAKRVLVRGLTAMKTDVVGKSDGVTFRVVVNGRKLMERHQSSDAWAPFQFDVTRFAGRRLVVRFETDPGPKRDSSFDYSLWADRAVVFEGFRAVSRQSVAPPPLDLTRMVNSPRQGVLPTCGYSGRVRTTVTGGTVRFAYSGADGRVEYVWTPKVGHLGAFRAHAAMRQDASRTVVPAFGGRIEWTGPAVLRF